MKAKPIFNLQTKIILLVCGVVALALLAANALITNRVELDVRATLGQKALDICRTMTHSPAVISGLEANDTAAIQEYANTIRNAVNGVIVHKDLEGLKQSPCPFVSFKVLAFL